MTRKQTLCKRSSTYTSKHMRVQCGTGTPSTASQIWQGSSPVMVSLNAFHMAGLLAKHIAPPPRTTWSGDLFMSAKQSTCRDATASQSAHSRRSPQKSNNDAAVEPNVIFSKLVACLDTCFAHRQAAP